MTQSLNAFVCHFISDTTLLCGTTVPSNTISPPPEQRMEDVADYHQHMLNLIIARSHEGPYHPNNIYWGLFATVQNSAALKTLGELADFLSPHLGSTDHMKLPSLTASGSPCLPHYSPELLQRDDKKILLVFLIAHSIAAMAQDTLSQELQKDCTFHLYFYETDASILRALRLFYVAGKKFSLLPSSVHCAFILYQGGTTVKLTAECQGTGAVNASYQDTIQQLLENVPDQINLTDYLLSPACTLESILDLHPTQTTPKFCSR